MKDDFSKRKTLYILNKDAYEYLEKQGNGSHYITELILNDMKENKALCKDDIIAIIKEVLENNSNHSR